MLSIDEDIQLYIDSREHGWTVLWFYAEKQMKEFWISDVFTEWSAELIRICQAILDNSQVRAALCDEPGGIVLELLPCEQEQHTMMLNFYEVAAPLAGFDENQEGAVLMSMRVRRQRLLYMLMSELWKVHVNLKFPYYQKNRGNFPHRDLIELNKAWDKSAFGPSFLR